MDYGLNEMQREIVKIARELAVKKMKPLREKADEEEHFPEELVGEFRKADILGVFLPEAYGGLGGGLFELALANEQFCRTCCGLSVFFATNGLFAYPVILFGTEEQRRKWLTPIAKGEKLGAFAITEPEAGSDATATRATARREGGHYVLNGTKIFCSSGHLADYYTTFFSTDLKRGARGITAFLIEKGTPGFTFGKKETKMGIRANPTYELIFKDCRVPAENRLGPEGYGLFVAQGTFDYSRPGVAAQALGIAQGALDETLDYIRVRKQFGVPVSSFQAIQHMFADAATQVEAARALLYSVVRAMTSGLKPAIDAAIANKTVVHDEMKKLRVRRWTKESGMVKVFCSDTAMKVTTDCVQMCGGIGFMRDFPVEKFMRDAKITQIYEGANQVQRNEIAMMIVKELAAQAGPEAA